MFTITEIYKLKRKQKQKTTVLYVNFPPNLVNDFYQKTDMYRGPYILLASGKGGIYFIALRWLL